MGSTASDDEQLVLRVEAYKGLLGWFEVPSVQCFLNSTVTVDESRMYHLDLETNFNWPEEARHLVTAEESEGQKFHSDGNTYDLIL